ncbi:uncharacterized protein LOC121053632 [Oryza brachyantha]|uniref:Uncharacterized protein n=1 Tax=Oryza brachyantha TaxID=4533 RepID=J3LAD5_ORYBR|nr:uncharacterized protein LOC121053632 [Oryza brachyantha]
MAMASSTRVWRLLAAVLLVACAVAAVRSVAGGAEEGAAAPGPASGFGQLRCNPVTDKTCRPGDPRAPENQEEEGGPAFAGVRLPLLPSIPGDTDDDDDELPSFDTHMTILGH